MEKCIIFSAKKANLFPSEQFVQVLQCSPIRSPLRFFVIHKICFWMVYNCHDSFDQDRPWLRQSYSTGQNFLEAISCGWYMHSSPLAFSPHQPWWFQSSVYHLVLHSFSGSTPQTGQLRQQMFTVSRISCYRSKIKVLAVLLLSSEGWEGVCSVSFALCLVIAGILWHSTAYRHIPEISAFICTWISLCMFVCVQNSS